MRTSFGLTGLVFTAAAAVSLASGCGDGGPNCIDVTVSILSPSSGNEITMADDQGAADGVQVDVRARVDGLDPGEEVTLTINGSAHDAPAVVSANQDATFSEVTLPQGAVELTVSAINDCDDQGSDSIDVFVVGDLQCELGVVNASIDVDGIAQPVLNAAADGDADTPGFQATVEVTTAPGFVAELFVLDVGAGSESSAGTATADDTTGIATFDLTLAEGVQALRAQCASVGGGSSGAAPSQPYFVDSVAPTCAMVSPTDGATIIPDDDEDTGLDDTQITLTASVTGGDTEGEPATFTVGTLDIDGSDVDSQGDTSAVATLSSPGMKTVSISGNDHAQNTCTEEISITYETDGCGITITAPTGTVTTDGDGANPGFQLDIDATIDTACAGRTATTTCDDGGTSSLDVTVPSDGMTTFPITACATEPCQDSYNCVVRVTNGSGITTTENLTISVDNQGPGVGVTVTGSGGNVPCGSTVGDSDDIDGATAGLQVDVTVFTAPGATRTLTQDGTPVTLDGSGRARITVADGTNALVGEACDSLGNCDQRACNITKSDLPVNFDPPFVNDAVLGADDGTVGSGTLTVDICGTVGASGASVDITITPSVTGGDGPATVTGTSWCRNGVTFPEPGPYTIQADATAGAAMGSATVTNITIDVTPPDPPTGLNLTDVDREAAEFSWTAPGDGGAAVSSYVIKRDTVPIDAGNFDAATTVPGPTPASPGTGQSVIDSQLRAGESYYYAIVSVDGAGNRSSVASTGPIVLDFTSSGDIDGPGGATDQRFGNHIAGGDLNDDGFSDIVVAAPDASAGAGEVHVFLGGTSGIASAPDFTFTGAAASGAFGNAIATLDWNDDGVDDLAVSAPFQTLGGGAGVVEVFYGGALFDPSVHPQARTQGESNVTINNTGDGFLGFAGMGFSMTSGRFDDDARDDLIVGMPGANSFDGAAAVILGGSAAATITVDDNDPADLNGAKVWLITLSGAPGGCSYGDYVHFLGRLDGAGDTTGDISIAGTPINAGCTGDDVAFVIRGRAADPPGDLAVLSFDPSVDLSVSLPAPSPSTSTAIGQYVGSVAVSGSDRDIFVGAHQNGTGEVYVVPGNTTNGGSASPLSLSTVATAVYSSSTESSFGRGLANAAGAMAADIDDDGSEDLLIPGGTSSPTLFIWFGPTFPSGSVDADASADHQVSAVSPPFQRVTETTWVGDVNGDGLDDICWSDDQLFETTSVGAIEPLY